MEKKNEAKDVSQLGINSKWCKQNAENQFQTQDKWVSQNRYKIILRIPKVLLHAVEHRASKQNRNLFKNYTTQNMHKEGMRKQTEVLPSFPK